MGFEGQDFSDIAGGVSPAFIDTLYARYKAAPDSVEPDPKHPDRLRAYRAVPERDGRVLCVVYVPSSDGARVATMFLDRGRRRQG